MLGIREAWAGEQQTIAKAFLNGITDYKRSLTAGSSQANLRQKRNSHKAAVSKIRPDIYRACAYMRNR
jgi:hypothetical protein